MVERVMYDVHQDFLDMTKIRNHTKLRVIIGFNNIPRNLSFEAVSVTVRIRAFVFVRWNAVPHIPLNLFCDCHINWH